MPGQIPTIIRSAAIAAASIVSYLACFTIGMGAPENCNAGPATRTVCEILAPHRSSGAISDFLTLFEKLSDQDRQAAVIELENWRAGRNQVCATAGAPKNGQERTFLERCDAFFEGYLARFEREPIMRVGDLKFVRRQSVKRNVSFECLGEVSFPIFSDRRNPALAALQDHIASQAQRSLTELMTAEEYCDSSPSSRTPQDSVFLREFYIHAEILWANAAFVSVQWSQWFIYTGANHGTSLSRYEYYDTGRNRFIADLSELFSDQEKVVDLVADLIATRFADSPYDPNGKEQLKPIIVRLDRWRFTESQIEIIFDWYETLDFGLTLPHQPVSYEMLRPYIKKDGPLGRALNLQ